MRYDAVIIGAGVTGSAIARELSRREGRFLVLERAGDVCEGTSKANSAIVHAGFDAEPGSKKAEMNVLGNEKMTQLAQELDIHSKNYISKLTEAQITRLIRTLKGLTFPITDYAPFEYAVTTAGGVSCAEVDPKTMQSLKVRDLYFAGEILDLDANTGGYNLQIAFSTGHLAGMLKK